jgi:hypothetical protein
MHHHRFKLCFRLILAEVGVTAMEAGIADHVWSLEEIVGLLPCF